MNRPASHPGMFVFDPTRPVLTVADARLTRIMQRSPDRCASVSEYAAATGMTTDEVIELLGPHLDSGVLDLEVWGSEIFVHTAPNGRFEVDPSLPQVAPNLWELLRASTTVEYAYALWRLVRDLQSAGHVVEVHPHRIVSGLGPLRTRPLLGIYHGPLVVPVLVLPTTDDLASPTGVLADYERAGADLVAVICDEGALESRVTAVRRWVLSRHAPARTQVAILEAPRFAVTVITAEDGAVAPVTVGAYHPQPYTWDHDLAAQHQQQAPAFDGPRQSDEGTGYGDPSYGGPRPMAPPPPPAYGAHHAGRPHLPPPAGW